MIGSPAIPKTKKTKNGQKIENKNFTAEIFSPFFKRPKNGFLWQKSGKFIIAFVRNGPKISFLTKNDQKIENVNFPGKFFFHHFLKDQKNRFQWQKSGKFIVAFGKNGPKRAFLTKNGKILAKKLKTIILPRNFFSSFFKRPKN